MIKETEYKFEHYEDIRAKLAPRIRLDGDPNDDVEYISDGEHSIEKYLERLEAKKKQAANNT